MFLRLITVTILMTSCSAIVAQVQSPTPSPSAAEIQDSLIQAQKENEKAQTEYYRAQTYRLNNPEPRKSFRQSISDNPASALGVVGAFLIALVTFVSFGFNYRATLNNQMDTQFYEALKRIGDKDSPAIRSSAAAMIAQMANTARRKIDLRHPVSSLRANNHIYFVTSRQQLVTSFLLEENTVALFSMRDAITWIMQAKPSAMMIMVHRADQKLERDRLVSLVEFLCSLGAENIDTVGDELWAKTGAVSASAPFVLKYIINREKSVAARLFEQSKLAFDSLVAEKKAEYILRSQQALATTFFRSRLLVTVYDHAFTRFEVSEFTLKNAPLCLIRAELEHAKLEAANLKNTLLAGADLRGADLRNSVLNGAWMQHVRLDLSKMYGARIDANTDLRDANWWAANFYDQLEQHEDAALVESLFERYPECITLNAQDVHPSVRRILKAQKKEQ